MGIENPTKKNLPPDSLKNPERRTFLKKLGSVALGAAVAGSALKNLEMPRVSGKETMDMADEIEKEIKILRERFPAEADKIIKERISLGVEIAVSVLKKEQYKKNATKKVKEGLVAGGIVGAIKENISDEDKTTVESLNTTLALASAGAGINLTLDVIRKTLKEKSPDTKEDLIKKAAAVFAISSLPAENDKNQNNFKANDATVKIIMRASTLEAYLPVRGKLNGMLKKWGAAAYLVIADEMEKLENPVFNEK